MGKGFYVARAPSPAMTAIKRKNMSEAPASSLLSIRAIAKQFGGHKVLRDISLEVAEGEFLTILGESGSGKTTLLRIIAGFEQPSSGEVRMQGERLDVLPPYKRRVNTVFQSYALFPHLTVAENVELPLALNAVAAREARRRSYALLQELGLGICAERFPEELSGGEQQRVAIARAVVHEPQLVLADEPTGNLDLETAGQVLALLRDTCERRGTTLVIATHSADVAAQATRTIAIRGGRIEERAS